MAETEKPRGEKSLDRPVPKGKPEAGEAMRSSDEEMPPEAAAELERQRDA